MELVDKEVNYLFPPLVDIIYLYMYILYIYWVGGAETMEVFKKTMGFILFTSNMMGMLSKQPMATMVMCFLQKPVTQISTDNL